jgi:hypothetical protein
VRRVTKTNDEKVSAVVWESPPTTGVKYDWDAIAEQLRTQPMKWAKVFDDGRVSVVNAARQGNIKAVHPSLGFEVRTANNVRYPVRKCSMYLRFNPARVEKKGKKG